MTELLASALRLSTPLIFAAMGGLICERSGIATICLEGVLLCSAWTAATLTFYTHSPTLGLMVAILTGTLAMGMHAFLSVKARADQIISALAVNILAAGLTPLLNKILFGTPTNSASLPISDRFGSAPIPFLSTLPEIGRVFFDQPLLIYLALILPFVVHYFIYSTRLGLRLIACGDCPQALETAGVSPHKVRWIALWCGGAITSFGGTYLSIAHASQFTRDMTSGRGFIALTALIFGNWKPLPTFGACLFFGLMDALQIQLQSTPLFGVLLPVQFVQAIPYLATLLVLVGFVGGSTAPLAIGKRE